MTSHMKSRTPKIHFLTPILDLSFARVMNGVEMQICITSRHLPRAETYKYECPFSVVTFLEIMLLRALPILVSALLQGQ